MSSYTNRSIIATPFNADVRRPHHHHYPRFAPQSSGLFDPMNVAAVPCHRHATDTEVDAAKRIAPLAGRLRRQTLEWVKEAGERGLTAGEGGILLARQRGKHDTDASCRTSIGPRLTELRDAGYVRDSGVRRERQIVWIWSGLEEGGE